MFKWLSSLFSKKEKKDLSSPIQKPVVITIHGYGRRRKHEMDNLLLWDKEQEFEIVQFHMYDIFDEKDCDWMLWVSRAKEVVDSYAMQKREIYLIGFSMGGVIASYLATVCPVKKLVLLAPAFQYIHLENIASLITKGAASLLSSSSEKKDIKEVEIPRPFYGAFMDLVKALKKYIAYVECPVLFIHGDADEVIPLKSSINAFEKVKHQQKKLFILHNGHHRLLTDEQVNWECFQIIMLFFHNKILHGEVIEQADDILEVMRKEHQNEKYDNETTIKEDLETIV